MEITAVRDKQDYRHYNDLCRRVYRGNPYYRGTEADVEHLVVKGPTVFHRHAAVNPMLIRDQGEVVGRFALIHDRKLPEYVQVSFFEALPGLDGVYPQIKAAVSRAFPGCPRIVVGLNGHLNYGAGLLADRFDEVPVFGLPYSQPYYLDYFSDLTPKHMVSYRFTTEEYIDLCKKRKADTDFQGITTRFMDKRRIREEIRIYTRLNNAGFSSHPYWAERTEEEDFELFCPFRFLLKNDNLIFAEYNGRPIGFFLWYPDFNQLVTGPRALGVRDVLRYRFKNPIDTFRFTEIGVLPQFRRSPAVLAMIMKATPEVRRQGYLYCEGGFIFEENRNSINMAIRYLERAFGRKFEPYRRYVVFEDSR